MKSLLASSSMVGVLLAGALFSGCAASHPKNLAFDKLSKMHADGLISLNRPAPEVRSTPPRTLLGFVPVSDSLKGRWIAIDRSEGTISLMEGDKVLERSEGEGLDSLAAGKFSLMHKQRAPLWYATDSYFSKRNLPVPAEGDKARFRRGALGDFALFVDKDLPIHAGPLWSEDVGGIRLEEDLIKKIYYSVEVGAPVEIS